MDDAVRELFDVGPPPPTDDGRVYRKTDNETLSYSISTTVEVSCLTMLQGVMITDSADCTVPAAYR